MISMPGIGSLGTYYVGQEGRSPRATALTCWFVTIALTPAHSSYVAVSTKANADQMNRGLITENGKDCLLCLGTGGKPHSVHHSTAFLFLNKKLPDKGPV